MATQKAPSLPTSRWSKNVINVGTNLELGLSSHSQQVFLFCSFNVPSKEEGLMSQIILDLFKSKEVILSDTIFRGIQRHSKVQISLLVPALLFACLECGQKGWGHGSAQHGCDVYSWTSV